MMNRKGKKLNKIVLTKTMKMPQFGLFLSECVMKWDNKVAFCELGELFNARSDYQ